MVSRMVANIAAGLGAVVVAVSLPAMAVPISFGGDVSIDIAPGSNFTVTSPDIGGNDILFTPHGNISTSSLDPSCNSTPCYVRHSRSLSAQISADPGRVISRFSATLIYGPMNNNGASGVDTQLYWDFTGVTYLGSATDRYGNFDQNGDFIWHSPVAQWKVTGDGTNGTAHAYLGWFSGPYLGTNSFNEIPGLNFFQVNAANFSIDLDSDFGTFWQGGFSYGSPVQMRLFIETAEAPPPQAEGVPLPTSTALLGLGLLGLGATRRRKSES